MGREAQKTQVSAQADVINSQIEGSNDFNQSQENQSQNQMQQNIMQNVDQGG